MHDLGIIGGQLYIDGEFIKQNLFVKDGRISGISRHAEACADFYDASDKKVIPGLIDPHVHFALGVGGLTSADDFKTGSTAAAYGGITTFIDFLDPVSKAAELRAALEKRKKLAEGSVVNHMFHATAANPVGETGNIAMEMKNLGLNSIKLFTTYSESGRRTYDKEIMELLDLSSQYGFKVLVHMENDAVVGINPEQLVVHLPEARSEEAETTEALKLAAMVRETGGELYMVHASSGRTVRELVKSFSDIIGISFHIESCPHYFAMDSGRFERNDGYLYTMIPPLRDSGSVRLLKKYSEFIETIGTDHCPYNSDEKAKFRLSEIPMGIGSVEFSFPIMHSIIGDKAIDKMSKRPAEIFGLFPWKGMLAVGSDADITIYDDRDEYMIQGGHSACDYNVYEDYAVRARIESTICNGSFVIRRGLFKGGHGKCLL
ncbi:MAG: amidohydrolase family protein [Clostridia bacterium]|nr:amidohydrolase family protein [Clostridia bacterium]